MKIEKNNNSGDRNSGNWNSGSCNSGNWNSGSCNSGNFNTDEPKVRIFGKETDLTPKDIDFPDYLYFDLSIWVDFDDMTNEEKKENPLCETTKGYLKTYDYKEAFRKSFFEADVEDVSKTLNLPNFDYEIFEEISGITKQDFERKLGYNIENENNILDKEVEEAIKLLQEKNILGRDFKKCLK